MRKPKPGYAYIDTRRKKKSLILKALFARPVSSLGQETFYRGRWSIYSATEAYSGSLFGKRADSILEDTRKTSGNRLKGHTGKNIQSSSGGFEISFPRNHNASLEPQMAGKRQRVISEETKK